MSRWMAVPSIAMWGFEQLHGESNEFFSVDKGTGVGEAHKLD